MEKRTARGGGDTKARDVLHQRVNRGHHLSWLDRERMTMVGRNWSKSWPSVSPFVRLQPRLLPRHPMYRISHALEAPIRKTQTRGFHLVMLHI